MSDGIGGSPLGVNALEEFTNLTAGKERFDSSTQEVGFMFAGTDLYGLFALKKTSQFLLHAAFSFPFRLKHFKKQVQLP